MRIAIDARPIAESKRRGVGRVGLFLIHALVIAHPEDTFILWTSGWEKPELPSSLTSQKNVEHQHTRIPNKLFSIGSILRLVSIDMFIKADILLLLNIGFTGKIRIPYGILLHDLSFFIEPRWFLWKQRIWHVLVFPKQIIRHASAIFSVSHRTAHDAEQILGIDENRIHVISLGSTIDPVLASETERDGSILVFGEHDLRKNSASAISAIQILQVSMNHPTIHLVTVNETTAPNDESLARLYAKASAVLYPSWYEGFGLPLHEASLFGTPCIASTSGALPETAPPGTFFANPMKPHHIAEALNQAIRSPSYQRIEPNIARWNESAIIIYSQLKLKTA